MGGALLNQWKTGPEKFAIVDPMLESAPEGVSLHRDADELDGTFDVIIVAIKPQMIDDVMPRYAELLNDGGYALSIAAGASVARISKALGDAPVVRVMPNLPASIGKGTSGVVAGPGVSQAMQDHAVEMMERAGTVLVVDEEESLDKITAVAGSGPGYVFEIARAYCAAAEGLGFSHDEARTLVLSTMEGTIAQALDGADKSLEDWRNSVTSKGGTTAAGLDALNGSGDLDRLMKATLEAAFHRAEELR
ncbi:pyrroline-5-carboxylate reductase dimerization domain-containing protein [Qipengyuania sp. JC766]|uniref:pyrroline-5-carboxylate reductase family protein n=1 Tax=Qipengyuania sp. JC766 TaxID=3232139 RepID=UPI003458164B